MTYTPDSASRTQAFGGLQIFSNDRRLSGQHEPPGRYVAGVAARGQLVAAHLMIFFPLVGALIILLLPVGKEPGQVAGAGHVGGAGGARRLAVPPLRSHVLAGVGKLRPAIHPARRVDPLVQRRVLRRRRRALDHDGAPHRAGLVHRGRRVVGHHEAGQGYFALFLLLETA